MRTCVVVTMLFDGSLFVSSPSYFLCIAWRFTGVPGTDDT